MRIALHRGGSFVPGHDAVHFWAEDADDLDSCLRRWKRFVVELRLGDAMTVRRLPSQAWHAHAALHFPYVARALLERLVLARDGDLAEEAALRAAFESLSQDASYYWASIGFYRAIAAERDWFTMPALVGGCQALLIGCGRHARLQLRNMAETTSAVLARAGTDKWSGRDLLAMHGIAQAAAHVVATPDEAVQAASELGYPVVLKAARGADSDGVLVAIGDAEACLTGAKRLFGLGESRILVEHMLTGVELRLHFVRGELAFVFRRTPHEVVGDGTSSVATILERHAPLLRARLDVDPVRRAMVLNHLHSIGVRTLEDLPRVVPPTGARVRMGHLGFQAAPLASVHPDDARSLEALFAAYGSPSAGVDVIVRAEGTPMADGGGVLELNLPCGAAYLGDAAAEVADRELLALVGHDAEFVASGGRVPVWLAHAAAGNGAARIEAAFRARFPEGLVGALAPSGWLPLLTDRRATAILAWVTDEAFEQHGIPERLRPIFVQDREASDVAAGVTGASVDTAGGTFAAIDDL